MKTICITGSNQADLQYIEGILTQAGMGQTRSAQRDTSMTIDFWHEQVESRIKELFQQSETVELGRVWEQIASDIFVANMSQETWGWADVRSKDVLDFWQVFDPQIRFVLVACSAQRYIAHALSAGESIDSIKSLMADWIKQHLQLLQFLHRFPQKTMLVDVEQCIDHPAGLIKACQHSWQLSLNKVHFPVQTATQFTTLEQFLARELSQTDDQWQVLQNELSASATPVGTLWKISSQIDVFDAVKAYRAEKESFRKEAEAAKATANDAQTALERKISEANPLAAQLKEAQEEAELLLTQLHQVQEELEKEFLENKENKKKIEESQNLQLKVQDLTKKLDAANAQVNQFGASQAENLLLKPRVDDLTKQLDTAKNQLNNSQKELNAVKAELSAAKAEFSAAQSELTKKISEDSPLTTQLKDVQEEADLLLAQLHQVQEELEHYFLKYQDVKNELESANQRWKRMLQRQPGYFDLESIEVVEFGDPKSLHINWRIKGLDAAGRMIPDLKLKSTVEGGVACLELPRKMGDQSIFTRWPQALTTKETLTVAVVGDAKTGRERADVLLQMGSSDWDLVQVILSVLINEIQTPRLLKLPNEFSAEKILEPLKTLQTRLAELPPVFRFDEIRLKREQVNPDYEHLWLDFRHVTIGSKRLLDFDFRISCAHVRPASFGEYPKLEFPEPSGRKAFINWFEEAYDDFGPKLELRFSFPQSMDLQVWEQLPEPDRIFLSSLINQIPSFLSELETSGINVKRGWADWQQMAKEVRRILAVCSVPLTELAKAPEPEAEIKKVATPRRTVTKTQIVKS